MNRKTWIGTLCIIAISAMPSFAFLTKNAESRLSKDLKPTTSYDISLTIDPETRKYNGHEKLTFVNRQSKSTNYLLFFLYPNDPALTKSKDKYMTVSAVKVNGQDVKTEAKGPSLRIYLPSALAMGQTAVVDMDFSAEIPKQTANADLFSQTMDQLTSLLNPDPNAQPDYGIFTASGDIYNLGLWYPAVSKFDADGWDEEEYSGIGDVSYYDPADFHVTLSLPAGYQMATTGTTIKTTPMKEGRIQYEIQSHVTRDFVVELSKKFEQKNTIRHETTIRSFFVNKHRTSGAAVLDSATKAFDYYEKTFGAYPYTELDVVEAPLFGGAGGVEFPGLVTISSMLYKDENPAESTDPLQQLIAGNAGFDQLLEFVVAHEVAHQWWNSVIGSNSKKFPYIDEAMANYSAILYFEHYYGRAAAEKQMVMQMKLNYQLNRLSGGSDQPVLLPASGFQGPLEYSAIVYGKGALYFDRLRTLMGDPAFYSTLKQYYNTYWFRIAGPQDFTHVAVQQAPAKKQQIEALYKRWIEETHGDEDIGPGTMDSLTKTILSMTPGGDKVDPEDLLKQMEDLLNQVQTQQ